MKPLEYAEVFEPLLEPARYKGAYGGRGSGKSQFFASLLVARALRQKRFHAVCIREVQKSLVNSAKKNVENKIRELGVANKFDIQKAEIITPGGGKIIFQGMQNHTSDSIKSLEDFDVAWVEEAQTLSAKSLTDLRPTLRKKKSELWFSWNPRNAKDAVDSLLRNAEKPPPNLTLVKSNYDSNPWFTTGTVLDGDRLYDLDRDPDMYRHVWLGEYLTRSNAQVFRNWKVEDFEPPKPNERLLAGCDWGFIDPTVLIVCFIRERTLYVWRESWARRAVPDQYAALFDKVDPTWSPQNAAKPGWRSMARNLEIVADGADPQNIVYMQRNGFSRMKTAIKGPGSIDAGVAFLQSYNIVVHPDCVHVADELTRYSYKVDKDTDEVTSELVDDKNHTIDSLRYAVENERRRNVVTHREVLL